MRHPVVLDLAVAVLVVLLLMVPFLDQAFHIDDNEFVSFARQLKHEPLRFYFGDNQASSESGEKFVTTHPPLLWYYLALVIVVSGGVNEVVFHSSYLIFPVIGVISAYSLGRRFTANPLAAALLFATAAGFVVMSHPVMGDAPATSVWMAAVACYVWGLDTGRKLLLLLATLFMALAVLMLHQALSLIPLLLFYALIKRKISWRSVLPMLAPILASASYFVVHLAAAGEPPRFSYYEGIWLGWTELAVKLRSLSAFAGGMAVFPLAFAVAFIRGKADRIILTSLMFLLLAVSVGLPLISSSLTVVQALMLAIMTGAGITLFYKVFQALIAGALSWRNHNAIKTDDLFLSVWILGVSFYCLFMLPFISVRHLLPLFAPLILLFVRGAEKALPRRRYILPLFFAVTIFAGCLLIAVPASIADYRQANSYREMAVKLGERYGGREKVWFQGEFDFRYYMEREGFKYAAPRNFGSIAPGDIIIRSAVAGFTPPLPDGVEIIHVTTLKDDFPVNLQSGAARAGFYNHLSGPLPIALVNPPAVVDRFIVYQKS